MTSREYQFTICFMSVRSRVFVDRAAVGIVLARELQRRYLPPPVLVLGLPRGGVPAAIEVARSLNAPLDVRDRGGGAETLCGSGAY